MRAAAIFGLSSSGKDLSPFQRESNATWVIGLPASSSDADAIFIFGGDGTVHRHLAQLVKLQLPVLVVPCGSGNDFARALKLHSIRDSVAAWRNFSSDRGHVQAIDLGVITPTQPQRLQPTLSLHLDGPAESASASKGIGAEEATGSRPHYFCCVAGVGLDVEIARRANQLPRWLRRRGGYGLSLLPALVGFEPLSATIQSSTSGASGVFTTRHDGLAIVVAFANAPAYGGGIKIAPNARLDDGQLDICIVGNIGKTRVLRLFPSVYSGRHLGIPEVKYFQTERLRLETERPLEVYADGEYVCQTPLEVTLERAALQVIVPVG
jgi:diacylglycerol kinase (ATP)